LILNDRIAPGPDGVYNSFLDKLYTTSTTVQQSLNNIDFKNAGTNIDHSLSRVIDVVNALSFDGSSKARIVDIMNVNHQSTGLHELQILLWHTLELAAANPATLPLFTVFYAGFLLFGGVGYDDSKIGSPYDAGTKTYSVETADKFYSGKPLFVLRRLLKLAALTGSFNLKVFLDWRTGNVEKNQGERAKEALVLATQLGIFLYTCLHTHIDIDKLLIISRYMFSYFYIYGYISVFLYICLYMNMFICIHIYIYI
jgi:hypothetical protein